MSMSEKEKCPNILFLLDETNHNDLLLPYTDQGEIQQHRAVSVNIHWVTAAPAGIKPMAIHSTCSEAAL